MLSLHSTDGDCKPWVRLIWVVAIVTLPTLTSCGESQPRVFPVQGQVLVKGKAAEGAVVVLHPQSDSGKIADLRPYGEADTEGRFHLSTFIDGDGAPAGEYGVTVEWLRPLPLTGTSKQGSTDDLLRGRYADPDATELTVTIMEGNNELPAFQLE